ncbi:OTU domain-containing protein 5 [Cichlidogyrus casuarinus]|uniref:ubiquitinyl hydrolase 1 n=1 Tax=Cichlidogyrus casuarinus TaxID=1844966 RepID=A0ABD2PYF4_9PLAT
MTIKNRKDRPKHDNVDRSKDLDIPAHQIFGDEEKHDLIRKQVCDYMLKNREHFSPYVTEDFDHYIARKQHPNCHGNHVEIQAIAELYSRPVEIYRDNIEPVNVFHAEYRNSFPIRLSYHGHVHYNSIIDPYNPTFGQGLGMPNYQPGLPEPQLVQKAIVESEDALIEDAMLRDKLLETDQLEIEHRIEDQVMRESYYEYLKTYQKSGGDRGTSSSRVSPKVSHAQPKSPLPLATNSEEKPLSPKMKLVCREDAHKASASNWRESSPVVGPSLDEALLSNIPPEMLDMDEDALMAVVLDQSRHEYVQSLNAKNKHRSISRESSPEASDGPSASNRP